MLSTYQHHRGCDAPRGFEYSTPSPCLCIQRWRSPPGVGCFRGVPSPTALPPNHPPGAPEGDCPHRPSRAVRFASPVRSPSDQSATCRPLNALSAGAVRILRHPVPRWRFARAGEHRAQALPAPHPPTDSRRSHRRTQSGGRLVAGRADALEPSCAARCAPAGRGAPAAGHPHGGRRLPRGAARCAGALLKAREAHGSGVVAPAFEAPWPGPWAPWRRTESPSRHRGCTRPQPGRDAVRNRRRRDPRLSSRPCPARSARAPGAGRFT